MNKKKIGIFCIVFSVITSCLNNGKSTDKVETQASFYADINSYLKRYKELYKIPAISCAIIKNGQVIFKNNYGFANLEHKVSATDNSIFRLYSLTKPIISTGVFQLIEDGKIDLEDKVSKYLEDIPFEWGEIQIKYLLSFSSGLPDMVQPYNEIKDLEEEAIKKRSFKLPLNFKTGEKFEYSQTNFWLLQKIIEKVSGTSVSDFTLQNQFSESQTAVFSSDARDIIENRATPYFPFSKGAMTIEHPYYSGDYSHSMNGLNLTLNDLINWDKQFNNEELISKTTRDIMWQSFPYTTSEDQFAYGWGKYSSTNHISYGFSGTGCTLYRNYPEKNISIIFLSNGFSIWHNLDYMANVLAHKVNNEIVDYNALFSENLLEAYAKGGIESFRKQYAQLTVDEVYKDIDFKNHLINIGFIFLDTEKNSEAINVFNFCTQAFKNYWYAYNCVGVAFEQNNEINRAIKSYERALQLNVTNQNKYNNTLKEQIKKLKNWNNEI